MAGEPAVVRRDGEGSSSRGRLVVVLFGLGLVLRLACLPLWGTFDTEIQKAWSARAATAGVRDIYGPSDRELRARARDAGVGLLELPFPKTVFEWRHAEYFVDYPPGSVLVLWAAGQLYRAFDAGMRNAPAFNAAINLAPLLGSLVIAGLLRDHGGPANGARAALLFWLNPAIVLAAPILGYQDTIFGAFALAAVLALMRRRHVTATVLVVVAGLIKPQGALLLPVLLAVFVREVRPRAWLRAILAGGLTAAVVLSPWWSHGYLLSALDGCRRPLSQPNLAPLGFGVWWIAGWLRDWAESPWPLARIVTLREFQDWAGWDARTAAGWLLLLATVAVVALLVRGLSADRRFIPLALVLQVHAYALFGTSVHENHSFLAVVLAPLLLGLRRAGAVLAGTSAFLFLNLFLTAGLGRRLTSQRFLADLRQATVVDLSVLVAVAHLVLVLALFGWALRIGAGRPGGNEGAPDGAAG